MKAREPISTSRRGKVGAARHRKAPSVIVLAAGASSRFQGTKQLAKLGGKTLIELVIDAIPKAQVKEIVVVLGHGAPAVRKALADREGIEFVTNAGYEAGMASSITTGISRMASSADGVLILLGDQPFVTRSFLRRMLRVFESGSSKARIVAAGYGDLVAPPAVFSREYFQELSALEGDQGARSLVQSHAGSLTVLDVRAKRMLVDVDTRVDLAAARRLLKP